MLQGDIILFENVLYVEVMYHFNEQVDFKISSKLIQASKGFNAYIFVGTSNYAKQKHLGCKKGEANQKQQSSDYMRLKALISAKAKN